MINRQEQDKPFVASDQELSKLQSGTIMNAIKEKWETVLILLTIICSVIGSTALFTGPRFDSMENRLDSIENRLDSLEKTVNENTIAITNLDNKLDILETNVDNKFDILGTDVDNKLDILGTNVDNKFDSLETNVDNRINTLETNVDNKFDSLETYVDNKFDSQKTYVDNKFNNLADVMITAHTVGDVTGEDLLGIWTQVKEE